MPNRPDRFIGNWILVPELCLYEQSDPPLLGRYVIESNDDVVRISIEWETVDGTNHHAEFGGPMDGSKRIACEPGITHLSITRVDSATLDSAAYVDGREVAYARRRASEEGDLLATVQVGFRDDGTSFRNSQVYRSEARKRDQQ